MRKAVSPSQKHEAVSLAAIVGAEAAAKQLGWDPRSIRKWSVQAGKAPADALGAADWKSLGELARSQVAAKLAAGKVSAREAAVIAGIASRNAEKEPEAPAEPDAVDDVLHEAFGDDAAMALRYMLHRLETGEPIDDDALLAEVLAIPDLRAWWAEWTAEQRAQRRAESAAADVRRERSTAAWTEYMAGRITAEQREAWIATGESPFAAEVAELIAEAEAFLRDTAA